MSATPSATPSPPQTDWWNPSSLALTVGAIVSGQLSDVYRDSDATNLVLSEVANPSNSFIYDFTFGEYEDVPSSNVDLYLQGYYDGNLSHVVKLQQWDYVTGGGQRTNITGEAKDLPDAASEQSYVFPLLDSADYLSDGNLKIRIIHTSAGNITHQLHLNKLYLAAGGASHTPSQTPSRTVSQTDSATPSNTISATPSSTVSATPSNTASMTESATPRQ